MYCHLFTSSLNKLLEHVGIVFWSNIIGIIAFLKVGVFFFIKLKTNPDDHRSINHVN